MDRKPRRILLKFGSGILTRPRANALDDKQFRRLTADVAQVALVFVDCQFWGKEGKMKGSTKSQKMDEPFSS